LIQETNGSLATDQLLESNRMKITCAGEYFKSLDVDYDVVVDGDKVEISI